MHELLSFLGQQGILTILTMAQHGLMGAMSAPVDLSYLADTVIMLRYFEAMGSVRKAISVIKKRSGYHEATIREYKTAPEHDLDLVAGRIDVAFDDSTYWASAFSKPENKGLAFTGPKIAGPVWGPGEALAFRQSDKDLKAKFDEGIAAALADGTVKRLSLKWLKVDATP